MTGANTSSIPVEPGVSVAATPSSMNLRGSVVVCTRNRGAGIAQTIQSLLANPQAFFELLVIDQSDDDATCDTVRKYSDSRLKYLRTPTRGLSVARNIGLSTAGAEIVLMTDDDCEVPPDWVANMLARFEQEPQLALVYCTVLTGPFDANVGFIPGCEVSNVVFKSMSGAEGFGVGAGFAVRRSLALEAGGFDPRLGAGAYFRSGEEHDLTYRLLLRGFTVACTNETFVIHHGFRTHGEGRALVQGYMFGYGAVFAKLVRCGHLEAGRAYGKAVWKNAARPMIESLVRRRGPIGVRRFTSLISGFACGLVAQIDTEQEVFRTA